MAVDQLGRGGLVEQGPERIAPDELDTLEAMIAKARKEQAK